MPDIVNVPPGPGLPPLVFAANAASLVPTLLFGDISPLPFFASIPTWGIYLNGSPVVTADSVVAVEYKQEWLLSDYPVERGGFETYDRVQVPFDARIRFASAGSTANRAALLDSVAAIAAGSNTTLYDVVTPEEVYSNVSVAHYDYRRTSQNGRALLIVDVWVLEVRQTGGSSGQNSLSNTQSPASADQTNNGSVQTTAPTSFQQNALGFAIPGAEGV